jgi:hypothetical protein
MRYKQRASESRWHAARPPPCARGGGTAHRLGLPRLLGPLAFISSSRISPCFCKRRWVLPYVIRSHFPVSGLRTLAMPSSKGFRLTASGWRARRKTFANTTPTDSAARHVPCRPHSLAASRPRPLTHADVAERPVPGEDAVTMFEASRNFTTGTRSLHNRPTLLGAHPYRHTVLTQDHLRYCPQSGSSTLLSSNRKQDHLR